VGKPKGKEVRIRLSNKYIKGKGIEIGALQNPSPVSNDAHVIYVDKIDTITARQHYPEKNGQKLVNVDVLDDGEKLSNFPVESLDFIIANHFLEHTQNPILTIKNHLARIKFGGIIYYAIPDKWKTFDIKRPLTTFEHVLKDYENGPNISYDSHFAEWVELVNNTPKEEQEQRIKKLKDMNYAIHFHVWDRKSFDEFLTKTNAVMGNSFQILDYISVDNENIAILQKIKSIQIDDHRNLLEDDKTLIERLLLEIYSERPDLQSAFPEVKERKNLSNLIHWAQKHGIKEDERLSRYASYFLHSFTN